MVRCISIMHQGFLFLSCKCFSPDAVLVLDTRCLKAWYQANMNEKIVAILYKRINGEILTYEEELELERWLAESPGNRFLYDEVTDPAKLKEEIQEMLAYDSKGLWKKIARELPSQKDKVVPLYRRPWFRYAAAAAVLIFLVVTGYVYMNDKNPATSMATVESTPARVSGDVAPGSEKAVLILADGTKIMLDSTANGEIAKQGGTRVLKEDGLLAYNTREAAGNGEVLYNTIQTGRSEQFSSLVLADGSKIWLNSVSSIRFPTAFTANDRVVEITGEVYFEVAKNPSKPFRVIVKGMSVEVLGTHFNINSYDDEPLVKATLLEGSVKVNNNNKTLLLQPGEQALMVPGGALTMRSDIELTETVAWKNGLFLFPKNDMQTIMRQVARWYGVAVVFEDAIPGYFVATLPRNVTVSQLLKLFEMTGDVHFDIDETKKLITVRR